MSVREVLEKLRDESKDEVEKGRKFEVLIRSFLKNDLQYSKLYDEVWLWSDYPGKGSRPDIGIDLVARERATGDLVAIQCKFYAGGTIINKPAIDSFLASSSTAEFSSRLFVTTSDYWGKNAKQALINQSPPVSIMSIGDLDDSSIDWSQFSILSLSEIVTQPVKSPRPHQLTAIERCIAKFEDYDRGRLVMACGTGKTFTSLRLTEQLFPNGGLVLFLVPSISLLSQAVREWSVNAEADITCFAVCSDSSAGKRKNSEDLPITDLAFPATTDVRSFLDKYKASRKSSNQLQVVFSTYQSIGVIHEAQKEGFPEFDLICCDEAHRTTGVVASGAESSHFMKVHDNSYVAGRKRLYMTATPKVFSDAAAQKAEEANAVLANMNDESIFGPEFHRLGFGEAVERNILTDYKVLVLAVDEQYVAERFQQELAADDGQLNLEDAAKIVGCWNGLKKRGVDQGEFGSDPAPMKRAVAFSRSIAESKSLAAMFNQVVDREVAMDPTLGNLQCEVQHVDGTFSSFDRNEKLDWLKQETEVGKARILSNARCLTEGVDVPALDAIMFLKPRESQIDVVQAVGRVMRKLEGKKYGYVILPIAIPAGSDPSTALSDNKKYRVVWQVLQALRSHDERFDAMVNRIDLSGNSPQIEVIGIGGAAGVEVASGTDAELTFPNFDSWKDAILAKIVEKVGERRYWEKWATDVADIARRHILLIESLLGTGDETLAKHFSNFLHGLQDNLNPSITRDDAVEMLSQHLITAPVFKSLFGSYEFVNRNPVSQVMERMVSALGSDKFVAEMNSLKPFYDSVELRAQGVTNPEGRQVIIKELYEEFFRNAFPETSSTLGIVYTPIEVVDFMIRSTEQLLQDELGCSIADEGVKLLDPFTGTGTFVARLIHSDVIPSEHLKSKFASDIHANELVLLAYYIAAINIEESLHSKTAEYVPFDGLVLTDTFQIAESSNELDEDGVFEVNNARVIRQRGQSIQVIIGNPPYSAGLTDANKSSKEAKYVDLEQRIRDTFSAKTSARSRASLYDSYLKAFRWASDRVGDRGVIAFVSNGAWLDSKSAEGVRLSLGEEFSKILVVNLKGNARTLGEQRRREGGNVFGDGTRTPVTITFLIRNGEKPKFADVRVFEIEDYLDEKAKLAALKEAQSVSSLPLLTPTNAEGGDWINERNPAFEGFECLVDKQGGSGGIFSNYTNGMKTNRDFWVYNFSKVELKKNMSRAAKFYAEALEGNVDEINDPTKISWDANLRKRFAAGREAKFNSENIVEALYRPFTKMNLYFDPVWNSSPYLLPQMWKKGLPQKFLVIAAPSDTWSAGALVTDLIPDKNVNGMYCFPLNKTEKPEADGLLFDDESASYVNKAWLERLNSRLKINASAEDVFHYVFFILNSSSYQEAFASNLKKEMPRIPILENFEKLAKLGEDLARLFVDYESLPELPLTLEGPKVARVEKLSLKTGRDGEISILVNETTRISGFPEATDDLKIFGRSPLAWVVDRYGSKSDKTSGIENDANLWGLERGDAEYVVRLIGQVAYLAQETQRIYSQAGNLNWDEALVLAN